ncbi:hypothetical protein [Methylocystis sp. ATCC 49242]|uniref:hypothetical protein n=1 Tax=Methylocystis sp. ATCC 49242 TaxID=622637 RepID=UPI0001F86AAB|nr:hypothetical protein [Methylocystis sp. ATCC 49242]
MTTRKRGATGPAERAVSTIDDRTLVSVQSAADLLGVTPRWVRQLCADGRVAKAAPGVVPLAEVIRAYIASLKDESKKTTKSEAAAEVQRARAEEIRLRVAIKQGELIPMTEIEPVFSDILGELRSRLAGVPAACTRDLALRETIEARLEEALDEARGDFDRRAEELASPGGSKK